MAFLFLLSSPTATGLVAVDSGEMCSASEGGKSTRMALAWIDQSADPYLL
jgi:hypothetical protein